MVMAEQLVTVTIQGGGCISILECILTNILMYQVCFNGGNVLDSCVLHASSTLAVEFRGDYIM